MSIFSSLTTLLAILQEPRSSIYSESVMTGNVMANVALVLSLECAWSHVACVLNVSCAVHVLDLLQFTDVHSHSFSVTPHQSIQ